MCVICARFAANNNNNNNNNKLLSVACQFSMSRWASNRKTQTEFLQSAESHMCLSGRTQVFKSTRRGSRRSPASYRSPLTDNAVYNFAESSPRLSHTHSVCRELRERERERERESGAESSVSSSDTATGTEQ